MSRIGDFLKDRGRYVVAALALVVAFVLSIQFGQRGSQFDLDQSALQAAQKSPSKGEYELSKLEVLNRALLQIHDNYVEPERIDPNTMLRAALDEVQNNLPTVVVEYKGDEDDPEAVEVKVVDETRTFELRALESLWEMSFRLEEIFQFVQAHTTLDEGTTYKDIEYAAINGMLSKLDPHSNLLSPEHFEEMQTQTGGEFGGLGIVISIRDGRLTVISPIDGTPAAAKGIKSRDKIVRIEDESTINMNLNEAVSMLRGKPGTKVDIWVSRKNWSDPRKFTIERAKIQIQSVTREPLGDKVGYIRIKNFQANTLSDMKKGLEKLKEKMGGMQGLVLDLRDNPGGLLDQAIKVADLFLEEGTIVSTVGAGNKMRNKKTASKSGTEPDYPITVLVNAGSASASEIVSGALQNHDRALVVGERTFGKGTVQVLYENPDGSALKLTVAQYLTPGGVSIQSQGIVPDLRMIPAEITKDNADLFLSDNILREGDLDSHLSQKAAGMAENEGVAFLRYVKEQQEESSEFQDPNAFQEDFQINLTQRLLAEVGSTTNRDEMLKKLQPKLEEIYDEQLSKIQDELEKVGVDWSDGSTPDEPSFDFEVETVDVEEPIEAGSEVTLKATFKNTGDKPYHRMKAITSSANDALDDKEFLFGRVEPGGSKSWSVTTQIPKDSATRHDLVEFEISNDDENFGVPKTRKVEIDALSRPRFSFNYEIEDANGDGIFQKDEEVTLRLFIENVGEADAGETLAYLKNKKDDALFLEKGRVTLEDVPKGESKPVEFKFRIEENETAQKRKSVRLQVDVYDQTFREFVQKEIEVPYASAKSVEEVSGRATVSKGPAKVFAAAHGKSSVLATVPQSAEFPTIGKVGKKWWKLDLGRQTGWVQKKYVSVDDNAEGEPSADDVAWSNFESPKIELSPGERMTSSESVPLSGTISDNVSVKDYYIFVYHQEDASTLRSRKLLYKKVGNQSADIDADIRLFKGMNRISVVSRDGEEMSTQETFHVYRK